MKTSIFGGFLSWFGGWYPGQVLQVLELESFQTTSDLIPLWSPWYVLGQEGSLFLFWNSLQDLVSEPLRKRLYQQSSGSWWLPTHFGVLWLHVWQQGCPGQGFRLSAGVVEEIVSAGAGRPRTQAGGTSPGALTLGWAPSAERLLWRSLLLPMKWVGPIDPLISEAAGRIFASMLLLSYCIVLACLKAFHIEIRLKKSNRILLFCFVSFF